MAAMINSSVLACNYAISGTAMSELNAKMPSSVVAAAGQKVVPAIRAQQARVSVDSQKTEGRRAALLFLAATAFTSASAAASNSFANAGVIDDYHLSLMIWVWNAKVRTSTSVVPMYSGNGNQEKRNGSNLLISSATPNMYVAKFLLNSKTSILSSASCDLIIVPSISIFFCSVSCFWLKDEQQLS